MRRRQGQDRPTWGLRRQGWLLLAALCTLCLLAAAILLQIASRRAPREAPEADRILSAQASMPFQILIPAYMPEAFQRAGARIQVNLSGPGGEPMVEIAYYGKTGEALFIRQWVPVHPDLEILAKSRPIQTKWGKGWLLAPPNLDVLAIWADVGPLRVAIMTRSTDVLSQEQLLYMADTLGPASNRQVFSFIVERPQVRGIEPAPPFEVKPNEQGVQELTLVITPGGYTPLRFAVRKGMPVRLNFRQLGQVGCGNVLVIPTASGSTSTLMLNSQSDSRTLEFTPAEAGEFTFRCGHDMYRGIMLVRE